MRPDPEQPDSAQPGASLGVELDDVSGGYARHRAVIEAVSGRWRRGEVTALLGPNGAGKSSLLRAVLGLLPWSSGGRRVGGVNARSLTAAQRARRIGFVPQRGGVRFGFTVWQVVAMSRHAHGRSPSQAEVVEEAMRDCDVFDLRARPYTELSGGQQRRVLLARAAAQVAGRSAVAVLADEPTAGLDLRHVEAAMGLLRRLAQRGLAVAVVLHDVNLAARWADRVWLMHDGRVIEQGDASDVLLPVTLRQVYGLELRAVRDPATETDILLPRETA